MIPGSRIAIIGGGWAGLSCAVWLSHLKPSLQITLLEAAPHFGGRARGLDWVISQRPTPLAIDNGQHLTIGAYRETFTLLKMVGAPHWDVRPLQWAGVTSKGIVAQRWQIPGIAWPWRFWSALIPGRGPSGWPLSWKWAISKTIISLLANHWCVGRMTAKEWLTQHKMPEEFVSHFWRPLCEGALNTALEEASADILAVVLRDALAGPAGATNVLTPKINLSVDGVDPMVHWLGQRGVRLLPRHLVSHASSTPQGIHLQCRDGSPIDTVDDVVFALPAKPSIRLWDDSSLPNTAARARWAALEFRPITTAWIALKIEQEAVLRHLPDWFVLNPPHQGPHLGQVVVKRDGTIGVVISAHGIGDLDQAKRALSEQLMNQLGIDCQENPQKWITEKHATWAATPGAPIASLDESKGLTGVPHIYRCADDCEPGYPATIESAVRSGKRTAETIVNQMSI